MSKNYQEFVFQDYSQVSIVGKVINLSEKNNKMYCELKNASIDYQSSKIKSAKLLVIFSEVNSLKIGNTISLEAQYKSFSRARNPGNFDEQKYYHSLGIEAKFYATTYTVIDGNSFLVANALRRIKVVLEQTINRFCNEEDASLFKALLLGDKSDIDEEINDLYRNNGIAHILAISGLHISFIGIGIYKLLRRKFMYTTSAVISGIIIIGYGLMTGSAVSIIRAVYMFLIKLMAEVLGRTYDLNIALAVAGFLLLYENPYFLMNSAFALSFLAILAIGIFAPISEQFFVLKKRLTQSLHISLIISVITIPIIVNMYFTLPLYSTLINIIVIPLLSIVLVSGTVSTLTGLLCIPVGQFFAGVGCYILKFYKILCIWFLGLPFSTIVVGQFSLGKILIFYSIMGVFACIMYKINQLELDINYLKVRWMKKTISIVVIFTLLLVIFFQSHKYLEITMFDVGQGESILIRNANGNVFLIDMGSVDVNMVAKYRVIPAIKSKGINKIDYIFITHLDSDHISGLMEWLTNYKQYAVKISNIVLPITAKDDSIDQQITYLAGENKIDLIYFNKGDQMIDQELSLTCLNPGKETTNNNKNENSLVLSMVYKELQILFTGDIEKEIERDIIEKESIADYDILKVAHHGSNSSTTSEFLAAIKPEVALISCGIRNSYGHPHEDVVKRLEQYQINYYVTNKNGAINIISDGLSYDMQSYIK